MNVQYLSTIDLDNIILAGHSFGACSNLLTGTAIDGVKAILLMDCWFFPIHNLVDNGHFDDANKTKATPVMFNYT